MTTENPKSGAAEEPPTIFDWTLLLDRIVGISLSIYVIGIGCVMIWGALTAPGAVAVGRLLLGIFLAGLLGPLGIYWQIFLARNTSRAIPIGIVKRIVGSLAALVATAGGLFGLWLTIFQAGPAKVLEWEMVLGAATITVIGLYGLYAFAIKGVDVSP